jgi:glycosyltransferase involved in cell wall biosynthesis
MNKLNKEEFPLVSIVIPCFNNEKYIEECLDSVKRDPYPNIEVLIMDDGSFDSTFEIAKKWRSKNQTCFTHFSLKKQVNKGVAITVNDLIKNSMGDFIVPLASDDKLIPGKLADRCNFLSEKVDCFAVFSDCKVINEFSDVISSSALFDFRKSNLIGYQTKENIADELIMNWVLPGPIIMFKRIFFFGKDNFGFYDTSGATEDREMYLRLILLNGLEFMPLKVSEYRIHLENSCRPISKEKKLAHYKMRLIAEEKYVNYFIGIKNIYLKLSILRFKLIIRRLDENIQFLCIPEIIISVLMKAIYYSIVLKRIFKKLIKV